MSDERKACPTCGSAVPAGAPICDICGEDMTVRHDAPLSTPPAPREAPAASPTVAQTSKTSNPLYCTNCGAVNEQSDSFCHACGNQLRKPQSQARRGAKKPPAKKSAQPVMFSTTQWIMISAAAFILGAVMISAFTPNRTATDTSSPQAEQQQSGDKARPSLAQVNAAREAAAANASDMSAQLKYANILHDAMMLDQAIAQYKMYLATVPDNVDARVDLGICYFEQQKYAEAILEMEAAIQIDPGHQLGNYNLGIVNLNAGNEDKAREWFTKARDINPNSAYGQNAARILAERAGQTAQ